MTFLTLLSYGVASPLTIVFSFLLMCSIAMALRSNINRKHKLHLLSIFWMAFSDCSYSIILWITFLYPVGTTGAQSVLCSTIGALRIFFQFGTIGWYFIVCLTVFLSIKKWKIQKYMEKQVISHTYVWFLGLIEAIVPFRYYEQAPDGQCVPSDNKMVYWHAIAQIPGVLTILMSLAVFFSVCCISKTENDLYAQRKILLRTSVFVFVFIITWLPMTIIYFTHEIIYPLPQIYFDIARIPTCLYGVFNFFVWFLFFPDLRDNLFYRLRACMFLHNNLSQPFISKDDQNSLEKSVSTKTIQFTPPNSNSSFNLEQHEELM